jgi:hypothetical protein
MGKSLASPTESMIKEVSASFSEPQELSRERFVALDYFNKLPLEKSTLYTKYVDILAGLTLDSFEPGLPSPLKSIPHEIAHLVKEKDEPTLSLQVDSGERGNHILKHQLSPRQQPRTRSEPLYEGDSS